MIHPMDDFSLFQQFNEIFFCDFVFVLVAVVDG